MNELYHFGIKGMRWGVRRRDYVPKGRNRGSSEEERGGGPFSVRKSNPYKTVRKSKTTYEGTVHRARRAGNAAALATLAAGSALTVRSLNRGTLSTGKLAFAAMTIPAAAGFNKLVTQGFAGEHYRKKAGYSLNSNARY